MNLLHNPLVRPLLTAGPHLDRRRQALEILGAALAAVDPAAAVKNSLKYEAATARLEIAGHTYNLADYRQVLVVGAGKAGAPMAQAVWEILGERITGGLVTVKYGYSLPGGRIGPIELVEAGHPLLDEAGIAATRRLTALLETAGPHDLVLALISGGGSALLEAPVAGLELADLQQLTAALLKSGATINQMNAIRKHLSQVKGGQLARLAAPARLVGLLLSDVVGSPLDVIASGPTVPDTTTFEDAWAVLAELDLLMAEKIPAAILDHLQRGRAGQLPETPKPGDPLFERVQNLVIGDNRVAALAALGRAKESGFNTLLLSTFIEGEAREVARVLAGIAREIAATGHPLLRPACVIAGGETTVTVRGDGLGGRNQELALAAALALDGLENTLLVPLATDGSDGPTDAAGALVDGTTVRQARRQGLEPLDYLRRNDAYHFFEQAGGLLKTGPTNTNVNDLTLMLIW